MVIAHTRSLSLLSSSAAGAARGGILEVLARWTGERYSPSERGQTRCFAHCCVVAEQLSIACARDKPRAYAYVTHLPRTAHMPRLPYRTRRHTHLRTPRQRAHYARRHGGAQLCCARRRTDGDGGTVFCARQRAAFSTGCRLLTIYFALWRQQLSPLSLPPYYSLYSTIHLPAFSQTLGVGVGAGIPSRREGDARAWRFLPPCHSFILGA